MKTEIGWKIFRYLIKSCNAFRVNDGALILSKKVYKGLPRGLKKVFKKRKGEYHYENYLVLRRNME